MNTSSKAFIIWQSGSSADVYVQKQNESYYVFCNGVEVVGEHATESREQALTLAWNIANEQLSERD